MTTPPLPSLTIPPDLVSPPNLTVSPNLSRSRSAHGLNTATGRPAMWTHHHQGTLACLYLYTDLSPKKIIDVVFRHSPPNNRPISTDSANKKLNHLLDKEPRWLRPKSLEDMGSRLEQLALSSSQMSSRSSNSSYDHHFFNAPGPGFPALRLKSEGSISPSLLAVPHHNMGSWSAPASPTSLHSDSLEWSPPQSFPPPPPHAQEKDDRRLFASFLRRATVTSSSTTTSTSSLRAVLTDRSPAYRGAVRGLLRRIPSFSLCRRHVSPISDSSSAVMDWLDDGVAPTPYHDTPFPLPGDFLSIDEHVQHPQLGRHQMHLLESAAARLPRGAAGCFPWVTKNGLTRKGHRILADVIIESDWSDVDAFGNTLLHFVAVRGRPDQLYNAVSFPQARDVLQKVNTAGQTFLHVMSQSMMIHENFVPCLVHFLKQEGGRMDIYAQDHYGRNFFHMLRANGVDSIIVNQILVPNDAKKWNTRDAFGAQVHIYAPQMTVHLPNYDMPLDGASDLDDDGVITAQLDLVTFIGRIGTQNATAEHSQGRNGLHCLAAVNLSLTSASNTMERSGGAPSLASGSRAAAAHGRRRSGGASKQETDSSDCRMETRLNSLKELLGLGVSPNAYDEHGNTPLMAFAAQLPEDGNNKFGPEMMKLLIEKGADVHARNRAGETALHIAVRCGRKLAVRTLVEHGANVHARNAMGRSVLEIADDKLMAASRHGPREYARSEACRAWLSGLQIGAKHNPTAMDEWCRASLK